MSTTKEITQSDVTAGEHAFQPSPDLSSGNLKPKSDIVIFDGHCNFCKSQVRKLMWFGGDRLSFVSLHDKRVAERWPNLSHKQLMEQMYVVTPTDEFHGGADAVRYLSRRLPRLWFIAPLMHIPFSMPLWRFLYRKVANMRYRIAGKCDGDACEIHLNK